MDQDGDQLRLLSIFHYIVGGLTMVFALIPLIHVTIGASMLTNANLLEFHSEQTTGHGDNLEPAPLPMQQSTAVRSAVPSIVAWMFVVFGATFVIAGEALGICLLMAGRALARRRSYLFVFVVACVQCVFFPFGTALGVFTLIVLTRPSVKARFAAA